MQVYVQLTAEQARALIHSVAAATRRAGNWEGGQEFEGSILVKFEALDVGEAVPEAA